MNSSTILVLFASLLAPLAAQQERPLADKPLGGDADLHAKTLPSPVFDPIAKPAPGTAYEPVFDVVAKPTPGTGNEPWFEPEPAAVAMSIRREGYVHAKLAWNRRDEKFFGAVIASFDTKMIQIPGLPPLLATDILVASGVGIGGLELVLGKDDFDFVVYLQAVAGDGTEAAASPVVKIEGKRR